MFSLYIPLSRNTSGSITALLRWTTALTWMEMPVVEARNYGVGLLTKNVEHYINRIFAEEDVKNSQKRNEELSVVSSDSGNELYREGDFATSQISSLETYHLKKVGLFPDMLEDKLHFEEGDHRRACISRTSKNRSSISKVADKNPGNAVAVVSETPSSAFSVSQVTQNGSYYALADELISRGLYSSAHTVIQRIFLQCSSVPEAILAINFALLRGFNPDLVTYSSLIKRLKVCGEILMAETMYMRCVMGRGLQPDRQLLNSMVICYCKLGKMDEALSCFHRLLKFQFTPWAGACNAIIKQLIEKGRILEAYDCFDEVSEDSSILLHFCSYNKLVDELCSRGFLDEGLHVFDTMVERGVLPTASICKSLIIGFCRGDRVVEAEILCTEIESYGFVADEFMYTYIINRYCKVGKMNMSMRLFFKMLKMAYVPDVYTYSTLEDGFVKIGQFPKAQLVHDMMVNSGITPDVVTYQIRLSRYCKQGQVHQAMMLLSDMLVRNIPPNVHCFTVVMAALCKEKKFDELDGLYSRMLASGVSPDHLVFFTLVNNFPEGHALHLALRMLRHIAENCGSEISLSCSSPPKSPEDAMLEIEPILDDIARRNLALADVAFSIYIIALCRGRKLDNAVECLENMRSRGFLPTITAFNSLLKLLVKERQVEGLRFMQDKGLVPDQSTFLVLIHELCNQGIYSSAIDILEQIQEKGMQPNARIFNTILACLGKHRMVKEAENLFDKMLKSGTDPDDFIWVTMLLTYSYNGWINKAETLFKRLVRPAPYAYTAFIPAFIKKNRTVKSCFYLEKMLKERMPDVALYTEIMKQFLRKKDLKFAFRLFDLLEKSSLKPDHASYSTLISGLVKYLRHCGGGMHFGRTKSNWSKEVLFHLLCRATHVPSGKISELEITSREQVKSLLMEVIKKCRTVPDLYLQNGIISGLCWTGNMQEAYEHVGRMRKDGVHPNCVTFTPLIGGCIRGGKIDDAVAMFNEMNALGIAADEKLFNGLLCGLCKAKRVMDALCVAQMMKKRGYSPSKFSHEMLVRCLCDLRFVDDALRIYQEMASHNYVPHSGSLDMLISLHDTKIVPS